MSFLRKFEDGAIKRFNICLFTTDQMMEIVDECETAGLRIYGFDGFQLSGKSIQPFIEYSPDYSNIKNLKQIYKMARLFLQESKDLGLLFEIVVDDTGIKQI